MQKNFVSQNWIPKSNLQVKFLVKEIYKSAMQINPEFM